MYGLKFNGTDSAVTATIKNNPAGQSARTIEIRFKHSTSTVPRAIFGYGDAANTGGAFAIVIQNNILYFFGSFTDFPGKTVLVDGDEYLCSVTYDGTTVQIILNALLEKSVDFKLNTVSSVVGIGNMLNKPSWMSSYNGSIYEVRVWNTCRSLDDIKKYEKFMLKGNESGLLAYYNFAEGNGDVLHDLTSNSNNGSISKCTWVSDGADIPVFGGNGSKNQASSGGT